jgi:hypothetical protein
MTPCGALNELGNNAVVVQYSAGAFRVRNRSAEGLIKIGKLAAPHCSISRSEYGLKVADDPGFTVTTWI